MNRTKGSAVAAVLLAAALGVAGATTASADATPQARDLVGVGSDTSQFAVNYLADGVKVGAIFTPGFNAGANARLVSYDAIAPNGVIGDQIVIKTGTASIARPNGSGAGKTALIANTNINYARSSSTLSTAEINAGLQQVPFAVDGLKLAVSAAGTNAPASISPADMVKIYNGTYTNWNQLGGASGAIKAYIPQTGSGTRTFFLAQLQAANGGTAVTLGAGITESEEHNPAVFDPASATYGANAVNAVAPFSTGRAGSSPALVKLEGGFNAQRALYNVVRTSDLSKPWFTSIFGPNGFICGGGGKASIEAAGFAQLAVSDDGGVCGIPTQAATSNFTTN
jgi:ABC-type phosphate transport system substrate-binding protein